MGANSGEDELEVVAQRGGHGQSSWRGFLAPSQSSVGMSQAPFFLLALMSSGSSPRCHAI